MPPGCPPYPAPRWPPRQARVLEILRDDLRAGGEAGLHPRLDGESALDRLLRQNPCREHHRRIRGVGATGYRGDHDRAVRQWEVPFLGMHFDLVRDMPKLRFENRAFDRRRAVAAFGHPLCQLRAIDARMLLEF